MPALPNRDQHEAALAEAIANLHEDSYRLIKEAAGDPPTDEKLNSAFWLALSTRYREALRPLLEQVYNDSVAEAGNEAGREIDLSQDASAWAANYSARLAEIIVANRKEYVLDGLQKAKREGWTREEWESYLLYYFTVANATAIAVTETTTVHSRATDDYIQHFAALGSGVLTPVVQNDHEPCDYCQEKQDQSPYAVGWPPYHRYCRCYTTLKLPL